MRYVFRHDGREVVCRRFSFGLQRRRPVSIDDDNHQAARWMVSCDGTPPLALFDAEGPDLDDGQRFERRVITALQWRAGAGR